MQPRDSQKAVFFDRDGTLMEEVNYCNDPATVKAYAGTTQALRALRQKGWKIVVITNQSGIGRGFISDAQYHAVAAELDRQLEGLIDATYFCPDIPEQPTERRKPAPGMVREAERDLGLNLAQSFFIGDKGIDIECGKAVGCRTIHVETGHGANYKGPAPDFTARDVVHAISEILKQNA